MNKKDSKNAKTNVNRSLIEKKYLDAIGKSVREIYVQFIIRIYKEIPYSKLAYFSTLKQVTSPNFTAFRKTFNAKFKKGFIIRANTFDNVSGHFPIGFTVWDLDNKTTFTRINCNIIENDGSISGKKRFFAYNFGKKYLNDWLKQFIDKDVKNEIAAMCCIGNDFQHNNYININHRDQLKGVGNAKGIAKFGITVSNLIQAGVYFAVRKVIRHTWINHRDQFLYPNKKWEKDTEFQNDCLAYTLFNNNISTKYGINHWLPFMEDEIDAKEVFASHVMIRFITGKKIQNSYVSLFDDEKIIKREFSPEATKVFDAGRELWKYYHAAISSPFGGGREGAVNASLYDIKEYFKKRNKKGRINQKSTDPEFNILDKELTAKLKLLAQKIEPKVYEYGFLME
jgi:hypothetical protein